MTRDSRKLVEFFFDPISPYAWLASKELDRLEAAGFTIDCRPVLFAALLNAHGQKGPAEVPAKRLYIFRDVMRLAALHGWPFQGPPTHPYNPLRALRLCTALENRDERMRLARALLAAAWERGEDLNDDAVLTRILDGCGLAQQNLTAAADTPEIKDRLTAATRAAIEAGIFGVPTFRFQGELFWGFDSIDSLLWRAAGNGIDESLLQELLSRAPSAQRKFSA